MEFSKFCFKVLFSYFSEVGKGMSGNARRGTRGSPVRMSMGNRLGGQESRLPTLPLSLNSCPPIASKCYLLIRFDTFISFAACVSRRIQCNSICRHTALANDKFHHKNQIANDGELHPAPWFDEQEWRGCGCVKRRFLLCFRPLKPKLTTPEKEAQGPWLIFLQDQLLPRVKWTELSS